VQATLETSRLILRPFDSGDLEAAFGWLGDPTVMRFTPTGPDTSIDQTKARLANYQEHQTKHGFSKWIILDRRLGRPIGDSGLLKLEEHGWIDLGFRLAPSYWGTLGQGAGDRGSVCLGSRSLRPVSPRTPDGLCSS
jgi:ribosomal-protein-alanine N-acetyltransferase